MNIEDKIALEVVNLNDDPALESEIFALTRSMEYLMGEAWKRKNGYKVCWGAMNQLVCSFLLNVKRSGHLDEKRFSTFREFFFFSIDRNLNGEDFE